MSDKKISDIMTFKEYIEMMSGSGVIYESECRDILQCWRSADWIKVDEEIAPIVGEILVDASNSNRLLYEKIMIVVMETYPELAKELGFKSNKPTLTRIK